MVVAGGCRSVRWPGSVARSRPDRHQAGSIQEPGRPQGATSRSSHGIALERSRSSRRASVAVVDRAPTPAGAAASGSQRRTRRICSASPGAAGHTSSPSFTASRITAGKVWGPGRASCVPRLFSRRDDSPLQRSHAGNSIGVRQFALRGADGTSCSTLVRCTDAQGAPSRFEELAKCSSLA